MQSRSIESAPRYSSLIGELMMQAPVPVCVLLGPELRIDFANPAFQALLGRALPPGAALRDVFPELPADAPVLQRFARVLAGEPFAADEHPLDLPTTPPGAPERWFNLSCQPMRRADDTVFGIMIVAIDVSQSVRVRNTEISDTRRATEALENATRVKDEFLAMLGHELRNPLAPIVTALHLLRLRPHAGLEREIGIIERQVAHLLRLVDDLLDVSRITRGKIELRREAVEVSRIVAQAVEVATPLLQLKRQKLSLHAGASQLLVDADPSRLTQALTNLLTNASKYSPEDSAIAVVAERRGERICIRVRDWGQGIGPELLPVVFELFSQGPQAIDRSQGGLGLGLAIVKNLVEMHGGTVTANSAGVGKGSEFTISLPPSQAVVHDAQPTAAVGATAAPTPSVRRILIIDDNHDAADMLALVLGDFGHEVRVAYDAHEGLQEAAQFRPHYALLDIGLPTMSGYELAGHMRAIADLNCVLFAVTGYGQTGDRERALAAGFSRHFVKPTSIDELQAAIVGHL